MQKIAFTCFLMVTCQLVTFAQTEKGRWTAGVSVGSFEYQQNGNANYFSVTMTPSAGYFVANNLLVGAGVPFSVATSKNESFYKSSSSSVGISPFIRYYFGESSLKPYAGVSYGYSRAINRIQQINTSERESTSSSSTLSPSVGLAYFINRNVALNAGLNYNFFSTSFKTETNSPETKNDYRSLTLGIGFQLFFGK